MKNIPVSLIVSTYNWPQALELTLLSALRQSVLPAEILIADDGSTSETQVLIRRIAAQSSVPIVHVWQEDTGFRLAAIRNKAIAAARNDYIVQIDGDVILHRHFLRDHIHLAQPGFLVSGSRVMIGAETSAKLLQSRRIHLSLCTPGLRNRMNALHLPWVAPLMKGLQPDRFRGCNMAYWRDEIIRVNGYNEQIEGWGSEDAEMALRMKHCGIRKKTLKFAGIVYHLHHREASRTHAGANLDIQRIAAAQHLTRCEKGISQYLSPE